MPGRRCTLQIDQLSRFPWLQHVCCYSSPGLSPFTESESRVQVGFWPLTSGRALKALRPWPRSGRTGSCGGAASKSKASKLGTEARTGPRDWVGNDSDVRRWHPTRKWTGERWRHSDSESDFQTPNRRGLRPGPPRRALLGRSITGWKAS